MLVMVDEQTGDKYARAVGQKGTGGGEQMEWLLNDMCEELKVGGHQAGENGHVIFKSDGESSIEAVKAALAKKLGGKVVLDRPPKGESQSNSVAEEGGKMVREFVKLMRDVTESKANVKLDGSHAIIYWMIRWAAVALTRFMVGVDGLTAYERRRGRRCRIPMAAFGETVWYKKAGKPKDRNNMDI